MSITLSPYLNFNGNTKEAVEFYQSVLGGELKLTTFGEMGGGDMPVPEGYEDKIMHAELKGDDVTIMASEAMPDRGAKVGDNISLSLSGSDDDKLTGYFNGLSGGGTVTQPLVPAPWGDKFGMFVDKFGINWMVNITK